MMSIRRVTLAGLAALGALTLSAGPSAAATGGLEFLSSFNAPAAGFAGPYGITVKQSNGDVYVTDGQNKAVDIFNSAGVFQSALTYGGFSGSNVDSVAVGEATGKTYVADAGPVVVDVFGSSGVHEATWTGSNTPERNFGISDLVAVDNSKSLSDPSAGDVYVTDSANNSSGGVVDKLDAEGKYLSQFNGIETPGKAFSYFLGITVDSSGNVYLIDNSGVVDEYNPEGKYVRQFAGFTSARGVAVNGASGNVYVVNTYGGAVVDLFDSSGVFQAQLLGTSGGPFTRPLGMAVNEATGHAYVSDAGPKVVDVFGPAPLPPAPNTDPASAITGTSVTLHGDLNPGGVNTSYSFSYHQGTNCLGSKTPVASAGSGNIDVPEETTLTGLEPSTQYAFCFNAVVGGVARPGSALTFTTSASAPTVEGVSTSSVTPLAATLDAQVNPEKQDTTCKFEYGTSESYGSSVPCEPADLGSGFGGQYASVRVRALEPNTTYHYRVVAKNATGTIEGKATFKTAPALAPTVEEESSSNVGQTAASLTAQVNPNLEDTTCQFQYVDATSFNATGYSTAVSLPCTPADLGEGASGVSASANLTGLTPATVYHYRVLAKDTTGTTPGADQELETRQPPPAVMTGLFSAITQTSGSVTGTVNPEKLPATYYYQYGLSTEYGTNSPHIEAGAGSTAVQAPGTLEDLIPGTTYHYRLVAVTEDGIGYGEDHEFTTGSYSPPVVLTGAAGGIAPNTATITGTVNPQGIQSTYQFQVGTDTNYGAQVFGNAGDGSGSESVELGLANLQAGTTYHYRLVASNEAGTSYGSDQTFTTPAVASSLTQPLTPALIASPAIAFPRESSTTITKTLTNAQKLAAALKACAKKQRNKRAACKRAARKRYAVKHKATSRKK